MSKITKRKHVINEVQNQYILPNDQLQIAKVLASRGNNLHEVEIENGERFLASMPNKFRNNIWIKRGDYILISPIDEGDKVKAEICHILYKPQIEYIYSQGLWPKIFDSHLKDTCTGIPDDMLPPSDTNEDDYEDDEDDDDEKYNEIEEPYKYSKNGEDISVVKIDINNGLIETNR